VPEFSSIGPAYNTEPLEPTSSHRTSQNLAKRKQKPFLSKSSAGHSSHDLQHSPITDGSQGQGLETPVIRRDDRTGGGVNEDLEKKVDNLTAKIAELTALVMAQQNSSSEES